MKYLTQGRTTLSYELPLEVVTDFLTIEVQVCGYASMEYHLIGYRENPLVRLDLLINNDPVDSSP